MLSFEILSIDCKVCFELFKIIINKSLENENSFKKTVNDKLKI